MFFKPFAALTLLIATAAPLAAQEWQMPRDDGARPAPGADTPPLGDLEQELEGAMGLLFQRLQPHLNALENELSSTMNDFAPALKELSGLMDDIGNYQAPERLPNGDILIRRRADAPPPPSLDELQRLLPDPENENARDRDPRRPVDPWPAPVPADPQMPQTEL